MNKYDVHIYAVVRVKLEGIEAPGQREAVDAARKRFDEEGIGEKLGLTSPASVAHAEYADEVVRYLVDQQGDEEYERSQWYEGDNAPAEVQVSTTVDPDWIEMVCEANDLFSRDYCGYYLRGVAQEKGLGWLTWEDDEQHAFGQEPNREEALATWKAGRPLPQGYYRLDADFARRSWAEGVKLAGVRWYEEGDSDRYDLVVQRTLFGKQVYA